MSVRSRQLLVAILVLVFAVQTWVVYTDPAGRRTPRLTRLAATGSRIWRRHNCQSCHQVYGFGGFLGPDLTNAAPHLTPARLDRILSEGSGQMPAFHLAAADRRAVAQFLRELDRTGVGQARLARPASAAAVLHDLVETVGTDGGVLGPSEVRGYEIAIAENCIDCHLPNHASAYRSHDLTMVAADLGKENVVRTLGEGVPGKAMPKFVLSVAERSDVFDFLSWLHEHRAEVRRAFEVTKRSGEGSLLDLPWFEFR